MNKKGSMPLEYVVMIVIFLVVVAIVIWSFYSKSSAAGVPVDKITYQAGFELCKANVLGNFVAGKQGTNNADGDEYPDSCDPCLGGKNTRDDGLQSECFADSTSDKSSLKAWCEKTAPGKNTWDANKNQCKYTT